MLLVVAVTIVGLAAVPVSAPVPLQMAYLGVGGSVWMTDAAGDERVQLAEAQGFTSIEWAPDGEKLALVRGALSEDEGKEIHVVRTDGSVMAEGAEGYAPVWSSDSQQILYVTNFSPSEDGTEQALKVFDLQDGSDSTLVTRRWVSGLWPIERLCWSPQDSMIAVYVAGLQMEGHFVILDRQGKVVWEIPDFVYSPDSFAWSPDGQYFVYRDSGEPFMGGEEPALKIARAETQEIILSLSQAGFWPRWSPDGEKIAAFLWQEGGGFRVLIVDAESGELLFQSDRVFGDIWNSRPIWSPDGSSLLFCSSEEGETQVFVMDEHGARRSIASGQHPDASWSPDGTLIALAVGEERTRQVYVVRADGSDLHKVTEGWMPRWRPLGASQLPARQVCGLPILGSSAAVGLAFAGTTALRRRLGNAA